MIKYPTTFPCPDRTSYSVTKSPSTTTTPAVKGRNRHSLNDTKASYMVSLSLNFLSAAHFAEWQDFWRTINLGQDWFLMDLFVDGVQREMTVHSLGPWSSTISQSDIHTVNLTLEALVP